MAMTDPQRVIAQRIGTRIKELRAERGLSQEALARKVEMSAMTIWRAENDDTRLPDWDTLDRIAAALGVTLDGLLGYPEDPDIPGRLTRHSRRAA